MHISAAIFTDSLARDTGLLREADARVKLVFVVIGLLINLLSSSILTPAAIAASCIIMLLAIRVPAQTLLLRLAMPLVMAAVVLVTQLFFYGQTPLFTIPVLNLSGYQEGLARGMLVMGRVLGGTLLVLFLGMSTPAEKLFLAARWFRVPRTFIELALLSYRYIFVIIEEAATMRSAQRVRLGYHTWRQSMRSLSLLGAGIVLRTYDRAGRVFEAMLVRGYSQARPMPGPAFSPKDGLASLGLGVVLAGSYLAGRLGG